jgi:hypothetical protein
MDVTARTMISILDAAICQLRGLLSLITITAPPVCLAKSNHGWRASGVSQLEIDHE